MSRQWDYQKTKVLSVAAMDDLNQDGWELVGVIPDYRTTRPYLLWKRPKPAPLRKRKVVLLITDDPAEGAL